MDKITFIALRYGLDVNGGAEVHCRMLAERLNKFYDVEVLTTCIKNYKTLQNEYSAGVERLNDVTVRRFLTQPFDSDIYEKNRRKAMLSRKIRRMIYRLRLNKIIFNIFPIWNLGIKKDETFIESSHFYSKDLLEYIADNHSNSKALVFFSYTSPLTYFGTKIAPEKSVLIPTVHYHEGALFHSAYTHLFSRVGHIAFNSLKEQELAKNVFARAIAPNSIVAVGTDIAPAADFNMVREKYGIPTRYILYFGRVCYTKMNNLVEYFTQYKKNYGGDVALVLTGGIFMDKIEAEDIVYTGFVSEEEKTALIQNALIVVNPSKSESLSLLLLEAMQLGKTVLVNASCPVLKQHCIDSQHACEYYKNGNDFGKKLNHFDKNPSLLIENKPKAQAYVRERYSWNIILDKLKAIIEQL